ncbi:MAG: hypothetical protein WCO07_02745 [bacterium]
MFNKVIFAIKSIFIFLKGKFGLNDKLTLYRRVSIEIYSWLLAPILLGFFSKTTVAVILFFIIASIVLIFLNISGKKAEDEGLLLWLVRKIFFDIKILILIILLPLEPFLSVVYFRDNFYQGNNLCSKKILIVVMIIINSAIASYIWITLMQETGLGRIMREKLFTFIGFVI